jgi:hypothetical protein
LAGIALELTALAFVADVVMGRRQRVMLRYGSTAEVPRPPAAAPAPEPELPPQETEAAGSPMQFITEAADPDARYYRAVCDEVELLAGFYSDGRVRLADARHRFAGMLQEQHADLLEIGADTWSEVFVRETPAGDIQLELRGGPFDTRVLTCEPLTS